ncbi:MAG TPA: hypothetical protein VM050_04115 [Patescibacteria group bacterium]|nr:hypothetical protein [Patescibacteria group bacterium]
MINFLESIPENSPYSMAGFYIHATLVRDNKRFNRAQKLFDRWAAKGLRTFERVTTEMGIDYRGHFNCMGAPNPGIEFFIKNAIIKDDDEWEQYLEEARRHPTPEDLENAKQFTRRALTPPDLTPFKGPKNPGHSP